MIYQTVASTTVRGDVLANPEIVHQALEENLRDLGRSIAGSLAKILADVEFDRIDFGQLGDLLLAASRRLGRSQSQRSDSNGSQYGLVIGVSDYQHDSPGLPDLLAARNDAENIFQALNDPANRLNFEDGRLVLLLDEDATLRNIRSALSRWLIQRVSALDTVLIYFAGHGRYDIDLSSGTSKKEKYFLPFDFDPSGDTFASGLPMEEVTEYFERLDARNVVMIFDACHAGAAGREDRTDELLRLSRVRSRERVNAILAAAQANQLSNEDGAGGLFTAFLVKGLKGEADTDSDLDVTMAEVARYVSDKVAYHSQWDFGRLQQPALRVNDPEGAERLGLAAFDALRPVEAADPQKPPNP